MTFAPILNESDLPPMGAVENYWLDFKSEADTKKNGGHFDYVEMAKDVAAFTNADGGTIIIGAAEDRKRGTLGRYQPMTDEEAKLVRDGFAKAVQDRCSPAPVYHSVQVPHAGGNIVAVNVWPFPGQPVGVRTRHRERLENDLTGVDAFFFPVRVGDQTNYFTPEQLSMLMMPELRRTISLLRGIPRGTPVTVYDSSGGGHACAMGEVSENDNAVEFTIRAGGKTTHAIDQIQRVWRSDSGWRVFTQK